MKNKLPLAMSFVMAFLMLNSVKGSELVPVFTESMGTVSATTSITNHEAANGFDNNDLTMTDGGAENPADIRATSVSSGYEGASGGANVFFTATGERGFAIEDINTENFTDLILQFGYRKESASALPDLTVEYWDGTEYINLPFTFIEEPGAGTGWYLSPEISLPEEAQLDGLKIRWLKTGSNSVRIDDVKLKGIPSAAILLTNPVSISGMNYIVGFGPSDAASFELTGINLDNSNVIITAPDNFEISEDNSTFTNEITLTSYTGSASDVYVRLSGGLPVGDYSGNIVISGGGAENVSVSATGKVVEEFAIPYSNNFRSQENIDIAIAQGFLINEFQYEAGGGGYLRLFPDGYLETPTINFTEFDLLAVEFFATTFGGALDQELSIFISVNDGVDYEILESYALTTEYKKYSLILDLTDELNSSEGKIKIEMTDGGGSSRFRDFSLKEPDYLTLFQFIPDYFSTDGSAQRGFASDENNLYVVTQNAEIYVHDRFSGDQTGTLNVDGITGGFWNKNDIEVSSDGIIIVANTVLAADQNFKVYKVHATNAPQALIEYNSIGRMGDKITLAGSFDDGSAILYAASGNSAQVVKWAMVENEDKSGFIFGEAEIINIAVTQGATPVVAPKPDGSFYYTASGQGVSLLSAEGALIGAISQGIVAGSSTAMKYLGTEGNDDILAIYQHSAGNENIRVVRVIDGDPTNAVIEFVTPSMFQNANGNGTGDVAFQPREDGNADLYVLGTNNGIGGYTSLNLNITFPVYEPPTPGDYTVTFTVKDEDGNDITNATITLGNTTNPEGDYVFPELQPNTYNYSVVADGFKTKTGSVTIVDEDITENVVLEEEMLYTVTFTVKDTDDAPIEGAAVRFDGVTILTTADGVALFENITEGTYTYRVKKTDYLVESGSILVDDDKDEDITLTEANYTTLFEFSGADGNLPDWFGDNTERGFTSDHNHIYVASRKGGNQVIVLDRHTGLQASTTFNTTGITGGFFGLSFNDLEISSDGVLVGANVANPTNFADFKVYKLSEDQDPELLIEYTITGTGRLGDKITMVGSFEEGHAVLYAADGINPRVFKWTLEENAEKTGFSFGDPEIIQLPAGVSTGTNAVVTPLPDGSFYFTAGGQPVSKISADGTLIGSISTGIISGSTTAMKYIGSENGDDIVAVYNHGAGNERMIVTRVEEGNPENAVIIFTSPSMHAFSNANGSGDIAFVSTGNGNADIYVLATNNGVAGFTTKDLNITFPVYEPVIPMAEVPFSTSFELPGSWDNPGGAYTAYNEKTYTHAGWHFHSTLAVRATADEETFEDSPYSFRERGIFTVTNLHQADEITGFSLQIRDYMTGEGVDRNLKLSLDGGDNWETLEVINKSWFLEPNVFQEFRYFFDEKTNFEPEQLVIELDGGNNNNVSRINIGQFKALDTPLAPVYNLTLQVVPADAGTVTGEGNYQEGEEVTITAEANEGFTFINWTGQDDVEISDQASITFTMPASDLSYTANFLSSQAEILDVELAEMIAPAQIDSEEATVMIIVGFGVDATALTPVITISEGATIDPESGTEQDFTQPVVYTVTAQDGTEKEWTIVVEEADPNAALISGFDLLQDDQSAEAVADVVIDQDALIVDVYVKFSTNIADLTPTLTISFGAQIDPQPAQGDFAQSGDEKEYTITSFSGETVNLWTVKVHMLEPSQEAEIIAFAFEEDVQISDAVINGEEATIDVKVLFGTDVTTLSPTITVSEGATIVPAGGEPTDFSSPVEYTVTAQDGTTEKVWTVSVSFANTGADILTFEMEQQTDPAVIDSDNQEIHIEVVFGTDVTMLTPSMTISDGATIIPALGSTLDFSDEVIYTVTSEDGLTEKEWLVTVAVAHPSMDATLSDLTVDGETVEDFNPEVLVYDVVLETGTTEIPVVDAVAADLNATLAITQATELPGTATVAVTAEDGVTTLTYEVNFTVAAPPVFTLTLLAMPENGGSVEGAGEYEEGTLVPVSAIVGEGYEFVNWTLGEDVISTEASFSYTMPAEDVTLTANFAAAPPVEVATLAELRTMPADGTIYIYTGEAVIVAMDGFRNRKFIQDETAAILIDDDPGTITTEYDLYDVITNVMGQINIWNNMVRFQPVANTEPATDNTSVDPVHFALDGVTSDDQAKLIRFTNVSFQGINDGQTFANGQNYTISDGVNTFVVRTDFWNVDYIGEEIPQDALNITGVVIQHQATLQLVPRFADDMEEIVEPDGFNVTFNVDMSPADDFDPDNDVVYLTGSMFGWAEPGSDPANQTMSRVDDSMIWTVTLQLEAGTYLYKYFINEGWDGGEWEGDPNRMVTVTSDMVVDDVWAELVNIEDITSTAISLFPNPTRDRFTLEAGAMIEQILIIDLTGKVLFHQEVNDFRAAFNISLETGIYMVRIHTSEGVKVKKLQIQK